MRHTKPQASTHKHNSDSRKGHEHVQTTQIYLHGDLTLKQKALDRTTPPNTKPGRYRPPDPLLAFLESL